MYPGVYGCQREQRGHEVEPLGNDRPEHQKRETYVVSARRIAISLFPLSFVSLKTIRAIIQAPASASRPISTRKSILYTFGACGENARQEEPDYGQRRVLDLIVTVGQFACRKAVGIMEVLVYVAWPGWVNLIP